MLFEDKSLPIVVVVTDTDWHEPPRIRHQVTRQLVRFFNVIYVTKLLDSREDSVEKISDRLIVYSPGIEIFVPKRLNSKDPFTHHLVNRYFKNKILNFIKGCNNEKNVLVNFVYDFYEIMESSFFDFKVYFCFDEHPKMQRQKRKPSRFKFWYQSNLFQYYENRVAREADKCLATHYPLRDKLKKVNSNTDLFFPGHEFNLDFNSGYINKKKLPIKIAFMGYVTYNLLLDWLLAIIQNEDMFLYMIGPVGKFDKKLFKEFNNVEFIEPLTGDELHKKLCEMDVLIMPYNPEIPEVKVQTVSNKFFQYIAAGRPVVISDMPNYIEMPDGVIYRAKDAQDFVEKIRQAHEEDCDELIVLRQKIASENTWDERGNGLSEIIKEAMSLTAGALC